MSNSYGEERKWRSQLIFQNGFPRSNQLQAKLAEDKRMLQQQNELNKKNSKLKQLVTRQCPPQTAIKILGVWGEGPSNAPKNKKAEYLPKSGSNSSEKVTQMVAIMHQ